MHLDREGAVLFTVVAMPSRNSSSPRARLFKNAFLEKLTVMSPLTFMVSWALLLPTIAWLGLGSASLALGCALVALGLFAWTLFEYAMHRFPFHFESKQPIVSQLVYLMHGNHHADPNDGLRNLMPLLVSIPISALVWGTCLALLGAAGTWVFLGWISGYVMYDLVHYACHQWPMQGRLGSALKRHHMRHHYVDETGNFAISAIFWDRVFGSRIISLKR